jgi:hypothetical protein
MKNTFKLIVLLFLFSFGVAHAKDRNGNWWRDLDRAEKLMYVLGVADGTNLGYGFTTWKLARDKSAGDAHERATAANIEYTKRYMSKVTTDQIVDGLDVFYSDFRNRSISTFGATWLVLAQVAGDQDVEEKIISWRKNASRN